MTDELESLLRKKLESLKEEREKWEGKEDDVAKINCNEVNGAIWAIEDVLNHHEQEVEAE